MRRLTSLLAVILITMTAGVSAAKENWPREMDTDFGKLTIYQPQPESFTNNLLEGRAAVSVLPKGKKDPVFGVIWFAGKVRHLGLSRDTVRWHLRNAKGKGVAIDLP